MNRVVEGTAVATAGGVLTGAVLGAISAEEEKEPKESTMEFILRSCGIVGGIGAASVLLGYGTWAVLRLPFRRRS